MRASVCLQLVLEKVCIAIGGMFMLIGAGLHIAKEVGWLVSKGECWPYIPSLFVLASSGVALEGRSLRWLLSRASLGKYISAQNLDSLYSLCTPCQVLPWKREALMWLFLSLVRADSGVLRGRLHALGLRVSWESHVC